MRCSLALVFILVLLPIPTQAQALSSFPPLPASVGAPPGAACHATRPPRLDSLNCQLADLNRQIRAYEQATALQQPIVGPLIATAAGGIGTGFMSFMLLQASTSRGDHDRAFNLFAGGTAVSATIAAASAAFLLRRLVKRRKRRPGLLRLVEQRRRIDAQRRDLRLGPH